MIRIFSSRLLATLLLSVAAGAGGAHAQALSQKTVISVGPDAAGRPCQARRVYGDPLASGRQDRAYDLSCGRTAGLGRVYVFPAGAEDRLEAWRLETRRTCTDGRPQDWNGAGLERLDGLFCGGDAPRLGQSAPGRTAGISLAGRARGAVVAGDAALAAAPALERSMKILAGLEEEPRAGAPAGPRSALLDSLEAALGQELSGGGFADFVTLRKAAFENNSLWMFSAAELQFSDAIRMHASLWPDDLSGRADLQSERALNLSNQRRFAEAERAFDEARLSAEASGDGFMIAKVLGYKALSALNEGRLDDMMVESETALDRIADWRASDGEASSGYDQTSGLLPPGQRAAVLTVQLTRARALTFVRMGEGAKARAAFQAAEAVAKSLDDRAGGWLLAGVAQDAAAFETSSGRLEEARTILVRALETYRKTATRTRIEANLLMDLGGVLDGLGRRAEAFGVFDDAFAIYREQPENRGVGVARGQPYLAGLADSYGKSGSQADAERLFSAFETITSPAVAQTAAATAARLMAGDEGDIIRSWQDGDRLLRRALTRLSSLPVDAPAAVREAAEASVARGRSEVLRLQAEVDRKFPNYGVVTLQPVELKDLQKSLGPGERTIRFAIGARGGVGLIVDRDSVYAFRTKLGESQVTDLVNRVKGTVRNPDAEFDAEAAHQLFLDLFGPVQERLFAEGAPRRLIIEASGALASLPLGVLLTQSPDVDPESWLARRSSLVSVASMRAFVSTRSAGPSRGTRSFAGFGDFVPLSASPVDAAQLASSIVRARKLPASCVGRIQSALERLPQLGGTALELEAVKAATKAREEDVYLRERFTDGAVLASEGVRSARVVMFSTHGVFAADFPEERECLPEASLLTSAAEGSDTVFLDSARVLDLKLDADLVVLSACDTGNPEPIAPGESGLPSGGDALSGLARSFFYAGARSVLVSHWVLPDEDTVALMKGFFERLTEGESAPEALQAAQMAQIEAGAGDPLQWAAFTIVGAPPAI